MTCNVHGYSFEYDEPITIEWDTGYMMIVAPLFFMDFTTKKAKGILKLSLNSDSGLICKVGGETVQTNSIHRWKQAIRYCRGRVAQVNPKIDELYDRLIASREARLKTETGAKNIKIINGEIRQYQRERTRYHRCFEKYLQNIDKFERIMNEMLRR